MLWGPGHTCEPAFEVWVLEDDFPGVRLVLSVDFERGGESSCDVLAVLRMAPGQGGHWGVVCVQRCDVFGSFFGN